MHACMHAMLVVCVFRAAGGPGRNRMYVSTVTRLGGHLYIYAHQLLLLLFERTSTYSSTMGMCVCLCTGMCMVWLLITFYHIVKLLLLLFQ